MTRLRFLKFPSIILFPAIILVVGCNQGPETINAPDTGTPGTELQNPNDNFKFTDISTEAGEKSVPLILLGKGPADNVEVSTLNALYDAMIKNGQVNNAKQLRNSYDFASGNYKGDLVTMRAALAKGSATQWWNYGYISHRGGILNSWLPWEGNDVWSGSDAGPRLTGWSNTSAIEDGVTPSLRFNVLWNRYIQISPNLPPIPYGWTAIRKWNDEASASSYYLQAIRGYSDTQYYHVCFDVTYKVTGAGPYQGQTGAKTGCDGYAAGGPATTQNGQPYLTELYKIKFKIFYSYQFVAQP